MPQFWKSWNSKFRKNVSKQVIIDGLSSDADIAEVFADNFKNIYTIGDQSKTNIVDWNFLNNPVKSGLKFTNDPVLIFTAGSIDSCIRDLKKGKACGPDDLSAEHLLHAHPSLIIHIKFLFILLFKHGIVPEGFGKGIIIPLIKDKSGDLNNVNNYRGITLTPIISKVFESLILKFYGSVFTADDRQFGFKPGLGCMEAIFTCGLTINNFINKGSSVFAAALDVSKAFDRVNHCKLFSALYDAGLPLPILKMLTYWYSILFVAVRWNGYFSK